MAEQDPPCPYVSRGGLKLAAAIEAFDIPIQDKLAVDLGCNVGGFTDCLLQNGASKVYAVDTGYGALAWKLRNDERVSVHERSNALHMDAVETPMDLAVIDMGWTRQQHALKAARRWESKEVVSLIKPHYEAKDLPKGAILTQDQAEEITLATVDRIREWDWEVVGWIWSPIRGGSGKKKSGNYETLVYLKSGSF